MRDDNGKQEGLAKCFLINFQFSIFNSQLFSKFAFKLKEDEQRIPPNRRSDCRHAENGI